MNTTSLLAAIVLASAVILSGCIQEEPPGLVVMTPTPGPSPAVTPTPQPTPTPTPAEEVAEPTPTPNVTRTLCDYPPCGQGSRGSSGNVASPPVPEMCTLAMMLVGLAGLFLLKRR